MCPCLGLISKDLCIRGLSAGVFGDVTLCWTVRASANILHSVLEVRFHTCQECEDHSQGGIPLWHCSRHTHTHTIWTKQGLLFLFQWTCWTTGVSIQSSVTGSLYKASEWNLSHTAGWDYGDLPWEAKLEPSASYRQVSNMGCRRFWPFLQPASKVNLKTLRP